MQKCSIYTSVLMELQRLMTYRQTPGHGYALAYSVVRVRCSATMRVVELLWATTRPTKCRVSPVIHLQFREVDQRSSGVINTARLVSYAQHGVCNGPVSPSVCLSSLSTAAAACGGFAAERHAGSEISIDSGRRPAATAPSQHGAQQHGSQQQMRAVSRLQPSQQAEHKTCQYLTLRCT